MIKKFNNLIDFLAFFKDETSCQEYFKQIRFKDGEYCPHCNYSKIYHYKGGRMRCSKCKKDFTVKTGTVFGESKVSLQKWFVAIYLLTTSKKGISSVELAKKVGVTQKTAWYIDHRIRKAMTGKSKQLFGTVEVDETYVGGKEKNKHYNKRIKGTQGRNTLTKTPVMGMRERGGNVKATVLPDVKMKTIEKEIINNVKIGSQLYSDTFPSYGKIGKLYAHDSVNHAKGQYTKGDVHTNSIESFWTTFKRGYFGTYHYMSKEHLQRYIDEFVYRFNNRLNDEATLFVDMVEKVSNNGTLNYKTLTNNVG